MKELKESNGFKDEPADNQQDCIPTLGEPDTQDESESLLTTSIRIIAHPHAKSSVWKHFGFMPLGDTNTPDRRRVLCRLCLRELPYCNNTTNLQYHLQRNHKDIVPVPGVREIRTSPVSRTVRRAARVPERFRDSAEESQVSTRKRSLSTRVTACSLLTPTVTLEESEFVSAGTVGGSCGQWNWQTPALNQSVATVITRSLMKDCLPLSTVEGSGFQDIIRLVDPSFEFQSASQLRSQVVPSLYVEEKKVIHAALRGNKFCALTLDCWIGRDWTSYVGVACHFINSEWNLDSRYLATLERPNHQLPSDLSQRLQRTLSDWRLQTEGEVTGCTVEEGDRCVASALSHLRMPHVPCLASVLRRAATRAMQVPCVDVALEKLRRFSSVIQENTELRAKLHERLAALNLSVSEVYLLAKPEWFQIYSVLLKFHSCREALNEAIDEVLSPSCGAAALTDDELASLEDLEAVLRPLNEAADTLSNESYPPASLLLPLLFRLTRISLAETANDSKLLQEVKGRVRGVLSDAYDGEETQQLLRMAMFLDPRLKRLPFYNQEEKNALFKLVQKELSKLVKEDCADASAFLASENGSACKKSRLTNLLGDIFSQGNDDQDIKPRVAFKQPASLADSIVRKELQCYNSQEPISLEDTQPLHWWKVREEQYPNLSVLARKVLCIPATAVPMRRLLSEEGQSWNEKRGALAREDVADVVFLSHNLGQETAALNS